MPSESPTLPLRAIDYDPNADRQENFCERHDKMISQQDCTATGLVSRKDRCSDNLHKERSVLGRVELGLLASIKKTPSDFQSCRWPAEWNAPSGVSTARRVAIGASPSQGSSTVMLGLVFWPQQGFSTTCGRSVFHHALTGVIDIDFALWPRVRTSNSRSSRQPLTGALAMQCMASAVGPHACIILTLGVDTFSGCRRPRRSIQMAISSRELEHNLAFLSSC